MRMEREWPLANRLSIILVALLVPVPAMPSMLAAAIIFVLLVPITAIAFVGMHFTGLVRMRTCMHGVAVSRMRVMRRALAVARAVMLGGLMVMSGGLFVMMSGIFMMFGWMTRHGCLLWAEK